MGAVNRRIIVEGDRFVSVEPTEEAEANGLALALPQSVAVARPARLELTTFWSATSPDPRCRACFPIAAGTTASIPYPRLAK